MWRKISQTSRGLNKMAIGRIAKAKKFRDWRNKIYYQTKKIEESKKRLIKQKAELKRIRKKKVSWRWK